MNESPDESKEHSSTCSFPSDVKSDFKLYNENKAIEQKVTNILNKNNCHDMF